MGSAILTRYQIGLETTPGTAVAATRVLGCAPKVIPNDRLWTPAKYGNGRRSQYNHKRNDQLFVGDSLVWDAEHPLYFQALPVIHQCLLDGTITPAEVTVGQADYRWDVLPSLTGNNSPDTTTIEGGDDVQAYRWEYAQFTSFKLAGQIPLEGGAAPVTGEAPYFARQVTPNAFTASQSLHSGLQVMNSKLARVFLDTTWAGVGATEQVGLRGYEVELLTGNEAKPFGSGNRFFDTVGEGEIGAMITLDFEGNSTANAMYNLFRAGTERAMRFQLNGDQIGSGTTYRYQVDLFGYFAEARPINSVLGKNTLHRFVFVGKEDASGNLLDIDIVTNHNTI